MGGRYDQFETDEHGTTDSITDRKDLTITDMVDDITNEGTARWWWQAYVDEVKEDTNLSGAVSW